MTDTDERQRSPWRADVAEAVLIAATQLVFVFISRDWSRLVHARLAHIAWCLAALGWLWWRCHRAQPRELAALFVIVGLPLFYVFWLDGSAARRCTAFGSRSPVPRWR
jgi:hypothetical protein